MPNLTKIVNLLGRIYKDSGFKEPRRPGKKVFSDLYICQLVVVQNLKGYTSERQFLRYLRSHASKAFPKVPSQSQYNQRSKALSQTIERLTECLLVKLKIDQTKIRVIDATAVPVVKFYRAKRTKAFSDRKLFGIGYCAAKREYYYGQKLTLVVNQRGIPVTYHLMAANHHDVKGLKPVTNDLQGVWLVADKGYIGKELGQSLKEQRRITLITPVRRNQKIKLTKWEKRKLRHRQLIETINQQLKDHFGLERLRAKSSEGLQTRVRNIIFSYLMAIYFNKIYRRNLLSIKEILA